MIVELIMTLLLLSFIIKPVLVESEDASGRKTTKVQWELPMSQLLAQVGDFQHLIDRSWAGLDSHFGYAGPSMGDRAGRLMQGTLQNGVVLMTAGYVDADGRFTADGNAGRFEDAAKGMSVAFYDAAREGMRR